MMVHTIHTGSHQCIILKFTLKHAHIDFIDFQKAFNSPDGQILLGITIRRGSSYHLVKAIEILHQNLFTDTPQHGLGQGCSPHDFV